MDGYIEIELNREVRRLKFTAKAVFNIFAKTERGEANDEEGNLDVYEQMAIVIHEAICAQDMIDRRPKSCKLEDVRIWVAEEMSVTDFLPIQTCFEESRQAGKLVKQAEEAQAKLDAKQKNLPKKKD